MRRPFALKAFCLSTLLRKPGAVLKPQSTHSQLSEDQSRISTVSLIWSFIFPPCRSWRKKRLSSNGKTQVRLTMQFYTKRRMTLRLVPQSLAPHSALWLVPRSDRRQDMWGQARQLARVLA
jgi:hypothetical protein